MEGPKAFRRRRRLASCALGAALLLSLASAPARADAGEVYWANTGSGTIGRASLAAPGAADQSLIGGAGDPRSVAIDGAHVYWAHSLSAGGFLGAVGRGGLDGSDVDQDFIPTAGPAYGVALGAEAIYWTQVVGDSGFLGRARVGGYGALQAFVRTGSAPCQLAASPQSLFWANSAIGGDPGSVGRAAIGGESPEQSFLGAPLAGDPCGVAVTADHLYWADGAGGTIGRANPDGTDPQPGFLDVPGRPCGVAADGGHLYWTAVEGPSGFIGRAALSGADLEPHFIGGASDPCGIAVTPTMQVSPAPRSFAATEVRARSAAASVLVENTSSSALDLGPLVLAGADPGDFQTLPGPCTTELVPAGGSCEAQVRFTPQHRGARSADLRIAGNAGTVTVPLSGRGTRDRTRPRLTRLALRPPAFPARASGAGRPGTQIRIHLSEAARVRFTVRRSGAGRSLGSFFRAAGRGTSRRRFSGSLHGRALRPGVYFLRVVARDPAGNRSRPRLLRFRVIR
jgi:hypothetical protein